MALNAIIDLVLSTNQLKTYTLAEIEKCLQCCNAHFELFELFNYLNYLRSLDIFLYIF